MPDIVLKNILGQDVTYSGIDTVKLKNTEGSEETFSYGVAVEDVPINLDLANGETQTIYAPEGTLVKSAVVTIEGGNSEPVLNMPETELTFEIDTILNTTVTKNITPVDINYIIEGATYDVVWEGTTVTCTAVKVAYDENTEIIAIGNIGALMGAPSSEPFIIGTINGEMTIIAMQDIATATVSITLNFSAGGSGNDATGEKITFFDYDGNVVETWSLADLQSKTALPDNPTHEGLIAQGWNWTLADLKATNRAMNVGQMYTTSDGKTRLYIKVYSSGYLAVPLYLQPSISNGVTIDWGDGSTTTTSSTTPTAYTHTYENVGDYVITLTVNRGTLILGTTNYSCLGGNVANYQKYLYKAEIGNNVDFGAFAFFSNTNLKEISIPNSVLSFGKNCFSASRTLKAIVVPYGVTTIGDNSFSTCQSLRKISIPNSVTSIGASCFYQTLNMHTITIPDSITIIGATAFQHCYALEFVRIPKSVLTIGANAFSYCYSLNIDFSLYTDAPPTLAADNVFDNISASGEIIVPSNLYTIWITETYWSEYALWIKAV